MKKRSLWILALSALLCLSVLFSACSPADPESEGIDGNVSDTVEGNRDDIPGTDNVDYKAIIDQWSVYLKSVELEENIDSLASGEIFFSDMYDDGMSASVRVYGNIAEVKQIRTAVSDILTGDVISPENRSTSYYDLTTGKLIFTKTQSIWNNDLPGDNIYQNDYDSQVIFDTVIELTEYSWVNYGEALAPDWQRETTYSYFTYDGSVLAEGLKESADVYGNDGVKAVGINDTVYYCRDGKIVRVNQNGNAYAIPEFMMEYGEYRYDVTGNKVQVIDKEYNLVVNYTIPDRIADSRYNYNILDDGSVYLYARENCYDNEERYDYKDDYGNKYRVWHLIVGLDGSETYVDAPFIFSPDAKLGGITTKLDKVITGIELLGAYQYAEIVRIEDGRLATDVEFVILDNKLQEVAKLPRIFKNQNAICGGLGQGRLMVSVDNIVGSDAAYVVDAADGSVTRFFNPDVEYGVIRNGLVIDGKVYDYDLKELADLGEGSYEINGNAVYYTVYSYDELESEETYEAESESDAYSDTESDTTEPEYYGPDYYASKYVGYVDENGEFVSNSLSSYNHVEYNIGYGIYTAEAYGGMEGLYNEYGEQIIFEPDWATVNVKVVGSFDDGIVVRATRLDSVGYMVDYAYYIIK